MPGSESRAFCFDRGRSAFHCGLGSEWDGYGLMFGPMTSRTHYWDQVEVEKDGT